MPPDEPAPEPTVPEPTVADPVAADAPSSDPGPSATPTQDARADDASTPEAADYYSAQELDALRLSSKNHVDVPVEVNGEIVHILAAHPTPPVFDGPEDRNGLRNHDEIRFWAAPQATHCT